MRTWVAFLLFSASILSAQEASKEAPTPSDTFRCEGGGDVRTIKNERKSGGGCDVLYTKGGQTQSVASAQHETEYCDGVAEKMRATLEGAGFKCR